MLNEALKLARRGIAVFVLAQGSKKPPAGTHGVNEVYKDEDEIKRRWMAYPRANVGVALGAVSGLVGIDVDRNHGATDADLAKFPRTVTVRTRNGFHLYFKYPPQGVKSHSVLKLDGLTGDAAYLRSDGLYLVGPRSIVSWDKGERLTPWEYQWHSDAGGELSFDDCEVAPLPEWCLGKSAADPVRADTERAGRGPGNTVPATHPEADSQRPETSQASSGAMGRVMYGPNERHAFFVRTAAAMRKAGAGKEKIIRELHKANERNCNPPKPPEIVVPEIAAIADYAVKNIKVVDHEDDGPFTPAPVTAIPATTDQAVIDTAGDGGVGDTRAFIEVTEKLISETLGIKDFKKPTLEPAAEVPAKAKRGRPKKDESEKPSPYFLACQFLYDVGYSIDDKHTLRYHQQDFYLYNGRDYRTFHDESMRDEINRWLVRTGREVLAGKKDIVGAMIQNIKTKPRFVDPNLKLPVMMNGIEATEVDHLTPLENGLLDLKAWSETGSIVIRPHTNDYFCTHSLPFPYVADSFCPIYERILSQAFECEADRLLWDEILGIHLYQPLPLEHFFILQGEGANSKSVLVTILTCLLGSNNVSSVPLECFHPENFSFSKTHGKLANIISDQHDIENVNEGLLKQFVSREPMTYNRKFKDPITARPTAYLTICTNNLPRFVDKTDAIYRRLVLLQFTKQIARENQDRRFISQEFWNTSGELPGILNRALAGLRRVVLNGRLSIPDGMVSNVSRYRDELNPIAPFAKDALNYGDEYSETSAAIYRAYTRYCADNGLKAMSSPNFTKRLKLECARLGHRVDLSETQVRVGAYKGRVWYGLKVGDSMSQTDPDSPQF